MGSWIGGGAALRFELPVGWVSGGGSYLSSMMVKRLVAAA